MKLAARVGRSRKEAGRILENVDLPWGHQVAIMFHIVCALALEVPSVLLDLERLHGLLLMLSCPANSGDMWIVVGRGVSAAPRTSRESMSMTWRLPLVDATHPWVQRSHITKGPGRRTPGCVVRIFHGLVGRRTQTRVTGVGTFCVSTTRGLRPAAPGSVCAVEDGTLGDIGLAVPCCAGRLAGRSANHNAARG